jgi:hypothetical protein
VGEEKIGWYRGRPIRAALHRSATAYRLAFHHIGTYELAREGPNILWCPGPEASLEAAQQLLLGRVLSLALHLRGILCLHGSAAALGEEAVAFLAPKSYGKSTLAMALVRAGGRLITDDTLPVGRDPPLAFPGVHAIRLRSDSAARVAEVPGKEASAIGMKLEVTQFGRDQICLDPVPLAALYLLAPRKAEPGVVSVSRERIPAVPAALALVSHTKLGGVLGGTEAVTVLELATALASQTAVYGLQLPWGFDGLDEATDTLLSWHQDDALEAAVSAGTP